MPYPNEHACRLVDPGQFVRFRRNNDTNPNTIIGFKADGSSELQAFRYPKDDWTAARAQTHCQKHDGRFEAAAETKNVENDELERRFVSAKQSELRFIEGVEDKPKRLVGYAAIFNTLSEDLGGFRERVMPGAFTKSLKRGDDVRAVIEHQGGLSTLGRISAGTLSLAEDDVGLRSEIVLPDTQAGRDMEVLIERRDISQMSFAFVTPRYGQPGSPKWAREGGVLVRSLVEVALNDICPVGHPVYPNTTIAVRSLKQWQGAAAELIEGHLDYHRRRLEAFDKAPLAR